MDLVGLLARWIHLVAGIVWMGHSYVNVVLRPTFQPLTVNDTPESRSEGSWPICSASTRYSDTRRSWPG